MSAGMVSAKRMISFSGPRSFLGWSGMERPRSPSVLLRMTGRWRDEVCKGVAARCQLPTWEFGAGLLGWFRAGCPDDQTKLAVVDHSVFGVTSR